MPASAGFVGVNGVVVSTSGENVSVAFAQDLRAESASARFANLSIDTNLYPSSFNVFGTLTLQADMTGTDLSAGSLSTTNLFEIPTVATCDRNMSAGVEGEIKFCQTRKYYYCTSDDHDRENLVYNGGQYYCCENTYYDGGSCGGFIGIGTHSCCKTSNKSSTSTSFNSLVFYDGSWRCASNGAKISSFASVACSNNNDAYGH